MYPIKKVFATENDFRSFWIDFHTKTLNLDINTLIVKETKDNIRTGSWSFTRQNAIPLPAGSYWVGDLWYALPHDIYEDVFVKHTHVSGEGESGIYRNGDHFFIVNDKRIVLDKEYPWATCFTSTDPLGFRIKSGFIGMVPLSLCDMKGREAIWDGHIYHFHGPTKFWCDGSGVFSILRDDTHRIYFRTNEAYTWHKQYERRNEISDEEDEISDEEDE